MEYHPHLKRKLRQREREHEPWVMPTVVILGVLALLAVSLLVLWQA